MPVRGGCPAAVAILDRQPLELLARTRPVRLAEEGGGVEEDGVLGAVRKVVDDLAEVHARAGVVFLLVARHAVAGERHKIVHVREARDVLARERAVGGHRRGAAQPPEARRLRPRQIGEHVVRAHQLPARRERGAEVREPVAVLVRPVVHVAREAGHQHGALRQRRLVRA